MTQNNRPTVAEICLEAYDCYVIYPYVERIYVSYDFYNRIYKYIPKGGVKITKNENRINVDGRIFVAFYPDNALTRWKEIKDENSGMELYDILKRISDENGLDIDEDIAKVQNRLNILRRDEPDSFSEYYYKHNISKFAYSNAKITICIDYEEIMQNHIAGVCDYSMLIKTVNRLAEKSIVFVSVADNADIADVIQSVKNAGLKDFTVVRKGQMPIADAYVDMHGGLPLVYDSLLRLAEAFESNILFYGKPTRDENRVDAKYEEVRKHCEALRDKDRQN